MSDNDSSWAVVAYRTAQLEINQEKRFDNLSQQIEKIVEGFVTEKEMIEAKKESSEEHRRIWEAIAEMKKFAKWCVAITIAAITAAEGLRSLLIK